MTGLAAQLGDGFSFGLVLPEAALAAGFLCILASDLVPGLAPRRVAPWLGIAACAVATVCAMVAPAGVIAPMLAFDGIAALARLLVLLLTALILLASAGECRAGRDTGAWSAAVVAMGLGALLAGAAANFVTLWLGLELLALASYTLVAFRGGERRSAEAGMKFVLFGGATSAAMLFGISHVYGITGHLDFAGVGNALAHGAPAAAGAALLLAAAGVVYKLTLLPFHFYAPDVYQGSPALGVAAVSTLPKIAATAALVRGLQLIAPAALVAPDQLASGMALLAAASMLFASFTALVQRDGKRILAFSGIGHGAAVVLAVACLPAKPAIAAAGFYLLAYAFSNVGALLCLAVLERARGSCRLDALAGSWQLHPWVSSLLVLFLLSLAGVPPLAGFLGKWGVLQQALARGMAVGGPPVLTIAALLFLLASAVSAWSYLLLVRAVMFSPLAGEEGKRSDRLPLPTVVALGLCTALTLGLGVWLRGLADLTSAL